jgi:hypothetical protein
MSIDETYKFAVSKFLGKDTYLNRPYMMVLDNNSVMEGIDDICISMYPHEVIHISSNLLFRAKYEDIKYKNDKRYVLVLKKEDLKNKLKDFVVRSEQQKVFNITISGILDVMEDDLSWNSRINDYYSGDIKKCFPNLIYYRKKSFPKKNISPIEVDKLVLSAIYDIDASNISDAADCYIYYKNIISVYSNPNLSNYKTDLTRLLASCFKNNGGDMIGSLIENNSFDYLDKILWICYALKCIGKLNSINVMSVLSDSYNKDLKLDNHYDDLAYLASVIEKKDKILFIEMKDKGEKLVLKSSIEFKEKSKDYLQLVMENTGSYIHIVEGLKDILSNTNLEGIPKVFKYSLDDIKKVQKQINNVSAPTQSIKSIAIYISKLVELIQVIETLESDNKDIAAFDFNDWNQFYKKYLFDLQYRLQEIEHLDKEGFIDDTRYKGIDDRINILLNIYRKNFALYLKKKYTSWCTSIYNPERPLLNSDIYGQIDFSHEKIFIIIFDGMRLDAFKYIVEKYFEKIFSSRNTQFKVSYSLLPSITEVSRTVLYKDLLKDKKDDTIYITKSESIQKDTELNELLSKNKKYNIIIFDMFDRDGHKATEDFFLYYDKQEKVFAEKIKKVITHIPEDADVIIASDHGLMRIDDYQQVDVNEGITDVKYRYLTVDNNSAVDYFDIKDSIKVDKYILSYSNTGYYKGGGDKDLYSHGGSSLEEIIVPFVYSKHKENKNIEKGFMNSEFIILPDSRNMTLPLKLNDIEKYIISCVYKYKSAGINNIDLEFLLRSKFNRCPMVNGMINKLNKKLQNSNIPKILVSSAGEIFVYKLPIDEFERGGYIE